MVRADVNKVIDDNIMVVCGVASVGGSDSCSFLIFTPEFLLSVHAKIRK